MRSCRPVSAMRMAMFVGSTRASRTISRPETRPMLTWGSKNSAWSEAMTMSPVVTQSSPAPQHNPLIAARTGFVIVRKGGVPSCGASHCGYVDRYGSS